MSNGEVKQWTRAGHTAAGVTSVTVTLQDGSLTVKWSVKAYVGHIKEGVAEAKRYALGALEDLRAATADD